MEVTGLYFIYGMCVMFYCMMAWFFIRKSKELLSRLVAVLMMVIGAGCVKDLFFIGSSMTASEFAWSLMTAMDMVAVPFYAFILIELCRPGVLTWRAMLAHEAPFVILPALLALTRNDLFFDINVAWAAIYGFGYAIWTMLAIPKYHQRLKIRFSYEENINLNWLRVIMFSFFAILSLWILDCLVISLDIESLYLICSLVIWMFICYFIYRHESVIDELSETPAPACQEPEYDSCHIPELYQRIKSLFEEDRIYLDPHLKLSDVAARANSNRSYVSRYFNNGQGKSFFEFVNTYRVRHAKELLRNTTDRVEIIAEQSGFNSRQSFHRVFSKIAGCTPDQFRAQSPQE